MGSHESEAFALLPELDLKAKLLLTERLAINIGYNLLMLTDVCRTGSQMDRSIDTSQLSPVVPVGTTAAAGQARPTTLSDGSSLRAQGLTVGMSFTY